MKKFIKPLELLTACCMMLISYSFAQAPQAIPYQAVARDNAGNFIANQAVSLRFSVHNATASGTVVYQETQSVITNQLGLFTVNIGQGTPVSGTFSIIDWGGGSKFIQVEMDATGGTIYVDMGTQQMLSVPYALYSNTSGTSTSNQWTTSGNNIYNNNSGNVGIGTTTPAEKLEVAGVIKALSMTVGQGETVSAVAGSSTTPSYMQLQGVAIGGSGGTPGMIKVHDTRFNEGGDVTLQAGSGTDNAFSSKSVNLLAGTQSGGTGGNINLSAGEALGGGTAGVVAFKIGSVEYARLHSTGNVGIGTTSPAATALLDLTSTEKGFLPPRMTTIQRDAIVSPATGLEIYNTTANTKNVFNGTAWTSDVGHVIKVTMSQYSAVATTTGVIPFDNTIPQSIEGGEFMTLTFTPKSPNSLLIVEAYANFNCGSPGNDGPPTGALFKDSNTNAFAASCGATVFGGSASQINSLFVKGFVQASSLTPLTFKFRAGGPTAGWTHTFNGASGTSRYGGVSASYIQVTEVSQ